MKEIKVENVRSAIFYLQSAGAKESAQVVWDLLDQYLTQRPKPIVLRQDGPMIPGKTFDGLRAVFDTTSLRSKTPHRGASSLPFCRAHEYDSVNVGDCNEYAVGVLNTPKLGKSYLMCASHGNQYDDCGNGADWVQTFFGDENSATDVARYLDGMPDVYAEPVAKEVTTQTLKCEIGGTLFGPEYAGKCSRPAVGYIHINGSDVDGCESCGMRHGTTAKPFVRYA